MSEVVGFGVLALSAVVPVVVARTLLGMMMVPLTRRPAPAPAQVNAQQ